MYLPATFVQRLCVRTASGSDRIIFHLSFDIFHLLFRGHEPRVSTQVIELVADGPVATARGSDTCVALASFSIRQSGESINARQRTFRSVCYL